MARQNLVTEDEFASAAIEGDDLTFTRENGEKFVAGNVRGPKGDQGDRGLPGVNAVPADEAVATYAGTPGSALNTQLNATIVDVLSATVFPRAARLSQIPSAGVPAALTTYKSKIEDVRAGTDTLRVLCIGDSTTAGNDSHKSGGWSAGSWPTQAARVLTDDGIPAEAGMGIAPATNALIPFDGRWTVGSGWSHLAAPNIGWGQGVCLRTSNAADATGTLQFDPGMTYEKIDVYFTMSTNSGFQAVLDVIADGATLGQITNVGNGVGKLTFTPATATDAPVILDPVSGGAIYILGIETYTEAGTVRLANVGVSAATSFDWKNDTDGYASLDCIRAYAPDVTVIMLGVNDSGWTPPRAPAGLINDLTTIGTAASISGDVVLTSLVPSSDDSDKDPATQEAYRTAIKALAQSMGWGYLDVSARYRDFARADALGWMSDLVHPSEAGYENIAFAVADTLGILWEQS